MYTIDHCDDRLVRIGLSRPDTAIYQTQKPNFVYVITGDAPAIIDTGHPSQSAFLLKALFEIGLKPSAIKRVIATSWSLDALGNRAFFNQADFFIYSPDMVKPHGYDHLLDIEREYWRTLFAQISTQCLKDKDQVLENDILDHFLEAYYPPMQKNLRFTPLKQGHHIRAGHLNLEVMASTGCEPGHIFLYDAAFSYLFCGALQPEGMPQAIVDMPLYMAGLERVIAPDFKFGALWPRYGEYHLKESQALMQRHFNFLANFLKHIGQVLFKTPTLNEFLARDQGIDPSPTVEYMQLAQRYEILLEDLVKANVIEAEGEGFGVRRYGVGLNDPLSKVRGF